MNKHMPCILAPLKSIVRRLFTQRAILGVPKYIKPLYQHNDALFIEVSGRCTATASVSAPVPAQQRTILQSLSVYPPEMSYTFTACSRQKLAHKASSLQRH